MAEALIESVHGHALSPFVPAKAGTQGPRALMERLGPRFRGDERRGLRSPAHIQLSNSHGKSAPVLIQARGFARIPSLFPSPHRGGWRAETAPRLPGLARLAPDLLRRIGRSMRPRLSARHGGIRAIGL